MMVRIFVLGIALLIAPTMGVAGTEISKIWNTKEVKSADLTPFKKWRLAMSGFEKEKPLLDKPCPPDPNASCGLFYWNKLIQNLKGKDRLEQIDAINAYVNDSLYVTDFNNWGVVDYWETPGEFYMKQGDCEDYAITKYMALRALGFNPSELRLAVVKDLNLNIGHAVLIVHVGSRLLLLDNQIKIVVDTDRVRHYKIFYSVNEKYWWRHVG